MTTKELINQALKNGGITLSNYKTVTYKNGYQIAKQDTKKVSVKSLWFYEIVENEMKKRNGDCGLYLTLDGDYMCIETSQHFQFEDDNIAYLIGKSRNQESILKWSTMEYLYMKDFQ